METVPGRRPRADRAHDKTCPATRTAYPAVTMRLLEPIFVPRTAHTPGLLPRRLSGFLDHPLTPSNNLGDFQDARCAADMREYYLAMTPEFLATILPIVLLLALLYTLTHHARHNEITRHARRGRRVYAHLRPYLAVGLVASVLLFGLNEWGVPQRRPTWSEQILEPPCPQAG